MKIHPTAIVEDGAQLADDVEVGPYALIGPEVVIGPGCRIQAHAVITSKATIGERNLIGYGAIIGAAPQDLAHNDSIVSEVRIGDGNTIREYVTMHRGSKEGTATTIGNDCFIMGGCHFAHNVRIGNRVILANNSLFAGYASVDDNVVTGGGSVFHQFMRIGKNVMTRGGTRFSKDIPPYCLGDERKIAGLNVVGLRRAGFKPETRKEIRRAFDLIYRSGLNVTQALAESAGMEWGPEARVFLDFIRESRRGICGFKGGSSDDEND